jgi:uncharacterized membrane protein
MDSFVNFFSTNFSSCVWLAIVIIALIPTLESKIAIPFALNSVIWGNLTLSPFAAFLWAFLGSILPSYLTIILARKIRSKTCGVCVSKYSRYIEKSNQIEGQNSAFKKYLALTCFVAIPLPLTGVWSGSLIAGLTNLNKNYAFLSIVVGALISSGIMTLLCTIFSNSVSAILIISILVVITFLIIDISISTINSIKKRV